MCRLATTRTAEPDTTPRQGELSGEPRREGTSEPTLAVAVCKPFCEVLEKRGFLPGWLARSLASELEDRLPVRSARAMLESCEIISGDPALGLWAALQNSLSVGLLEYTGTSSRTVRESLETLARYITVVNESFDVRLTVEGSWAVLEFNDDRMSLGHSGIDFTLGTFYLRRVLWGLVAANTAGIQVWFRYPHPQDVRVHEAVFESAILVFGASRNAVVFPASALDQPMGRADSALHDLLARSIEKKRKSIAAMTMTQQVKTLLRDGIVRNGCAKIVSNRLGISERTLCRRLASENTNFQALLDEVRCGLAVRYLVGESRTVRSVAKVLGYSEPKSFYRAFRRWFGMTTSQYLGTLGRRDSPEESSTFAD